MMCISSICINVCVGIKSLSGVMVKIYTILYFIELSYACFVMVMKFQAVNAMHKACKLSKYTHYCILLN